MGSGHSTTEEVKESLGDAVALCKSVRSYTSSALRAIGNILTGGDQLTQVVINCSVVTVLKQLLYTYNGHRDVQDQEGSGLGSAECYSGGYQPADYVRGGREGRVGERGREEKED